MERHFCEDRFNLSVFHTGQANFFPIQLQPEISSASSADPLRCFPALSPKCQWHANEFHTQMSSSVNSDESALLLQFCKSRKTRQPHYTYVTFCLKPLLFSGQIQKNAPHLRLYPSPRADLLETHD